jgi:hypothetical protein
MFDNADSLSDCNKALIRSTWFPVASSAWTNDYATTSSWAHNTSVCADQLGPAPTGHIFTSRAELLVARTEWCVDKYAAAARYGPINEWNISLITDLSYIFCASGHTDCFTGCSRAASGTQFNDYIGGWDTSAVTTLAVRAVRSNV